MRKKYHCCIPGCTTYDTLNNFLQIPSDTEWRNKWLSIIPRRNWVVDHSTIACLKHFRNTDLLVTSTESPPNGSKQESSNSNIAILNGAIPTITIQSEVKSANEYLPVEMFQSFPRDTPGPELFEDIEQSENSDFVVEYWYLQLMYTKRLPLTIINNWKVATTEDYTIFYILDFTEIPRISISVKIDPDLKVTVTLGGREMDPADLVWILPINGKLNRWSQLHIMLTIFGKNNDIANM